MTSRERLGRVVYKGAVETERDWILACLGMEETRERQRRRGGRCIEERSNSE